MMEPAGTAAAAVIEPATSTIATVLVVEDSEDIRRVLEVLLARASYRVITASDGRGALRQLHDARPDLVLLDVGLPEIDGWEVLERIRFMTDVPVLMLTAHGAEAEKVRGLRAGADDYVTKPFGNDELLARIDALLRRKQPAASAKSEVFDDGRLVIDFARRRVQVDGTEVQLTPIEYRLLAVLAQHAGHVLTPEQLLDHAWNDPTGIGTERVKFAVLRLRRKLESASGPVPIETVRGFGYRYERRTSPIG